MKLRQNNSQSVKGKLSSTLRSWLPILQADIESLKETLDEATRENPFVEIKSGNEVSEAKSNKLTIDRTKEENSHRIKDINDINVSNSSTDTIEAMELSKTSLYDKLSEQIENNSYFPTQKSKDIAYVIIDNLNDDGYFDVDIQKLSKDIGVDVGMIERIRSRFQYLEPYGVGAVDLWESFLFQLNNYDLDDDKLYECCHKVIKDFENLELYQKDPYFLEALKIIKKFQNPPAIAYKSEQVQIIPDIFIYSHEGSIKVDLNDSYYPEIDIDLGGIENKFDFVKEKVKEVKLLIDALDLRKATLKKMAVMILEHQYDFFEGGDIKPMKLDDLAEDLGRHHSTISRAIQNKYISCDRGVFPIKSFFATAMGEDGEISNSAIKSFIVETIEAEDRVKPLSDTKILTLVEKKFNMKIGRRTVTKYRLQAGISSSSDRKKLYKFA
jgi:RNA polymerase sigma-54 factor